MVKFGKEKLKKVGKHFVIKIPELYIESFETHDFEIVLDGKNLVLVPINPSDKEQHSLFF